MSRDAGAVTLSAHPPDDAGWTAAHNVNMAAPFFLAYERDAVVLIYSHGPARMKKKMHVVNNAMRWEFALQPVHADNTVVVFFWDADGGNSKDQ